MLVAAHAWCAPGQPGRQPPDSEVGGSREGRGVGGPRLRPRNRPVPPARSKDGAGAATLAETPSPTSCPSPTRSALLIASPVVDAGVAVPEQSWHAPTCAEPPAKIRETCAQAVSAGEVAYARR